MSEPLLSRPQPRDFYGPITAIRGVSFDVTPGQIVTILGANGAGKTTVLKSVCGAMEPQKGLGRIRRAGHHRDANPIGWRATASRMCPRAARSSRS